MKIINEALLNETTGRAKQSPRLRMNYNFHEHLDDPVNRLLNALEPGTYLRPHRHLNPKKDEIFLLLRGRIAVFLFDNKGGNHPNTDTRSERRCLRRRNKGGNMARAVSSRIRLYHI